MTTAPPFPLRGSLRARLSTCTAAVREATKPKRPTPLQQYAANEREPGQVS